MEANEGEKELRRKKNVNLIIRLTNEILSELAQIYMIDVSNPRSV